MRTDDREQRYLALLGRMNGAIHRICSVYAHDPSMMDDLVQDVRLEIWKSMDRFENRSMLTTYVYRIALNTAMRHQARMRRLPKPTDVIPEAIDEADDTADERLGRLRQALARLSEADRGLMSLVLEGLPYADIAAILDTNPNAVGVRITRAKQRLMTYMKDDHGSD